MSLVLIASFGHHCNYDSFFRCRFKCALPGFVATRVGSGSVQHFLAAKSYCSPHWGTQIHPHNQDWRHCNRRLGQSPRPLDMHSRWVCRGVIVIRFAMVCDHAISLNFMHFMRVTCWTRIGNGLLYIYIYIHICWCRMFPLVQWCPVSEACAGDDSSLSIEHLVDLAVPGIIPFQSFPQVYDIDAWPKTLARMQVARGLWFLYVFVRCILVGASVKVSSGK